MKTHLSLKLSLATIKTIPYRCSLKSLFQFTISPLVSQCPAACCSPSFPLNAHCFHPICCFSQLSAPVLLFPICSPALCHCLGQLRQRYRLLTFLLSFPVLCTKGRECTGTATMLTPETTYKPPESIMEEYLDRNWKGEKTE